MDSDLNRIKEILLGEEYDELLKLRDEINDDGRFSKLVSNIITEALNERSRQDNSVAEVLAPTIDQAISSSINQDPKKLAGSLYPIMGPAIRKSISETMQQMLENLNQLLEDSLSPKSLRWRFDAWRTGKSYSELVMLNTLEFSTEQIFLIHRETSLLIHHQASELADTRDPDMVSGMFSAIQDFIEDSFSTQDGDELDTLRLGDLSVVIQRGPSAALAAVVRGRIPEDLRIQLAATLENLHRMKQDELANYGGDPEVFADIEDDLRKLLMVERKEPEPKGTPWLALLVIVALAAGSGYWYYLQTQWALERSRLVSILEQEPGLVVLDSEFSDGVLQIKLLTDPNARDPRDVIVTEHENFTVEFNEYSHLSALDEIVSRRALNLLQPNAETNIDVADGVLVLSGRADSDWMQEFGSRWSAVTGLVGIERSELEVYYPRRDAIASIIPVIESVEIYFENGESEAEVDAELLNSIVEQIQRLNSLAMAEYGNPVRIDLVGYTDESGTSQFNRRVGLERAQGIRDLIIGAGVDQSQLDAFSAFDHPSGDGVAAERVAERVVRFVVGPSTLIR